MEYNERLIEYRNSVNKFIVQYNMLQEKIEDASNKYEEYFSELKSYDASIIILQSLAGSLQNNVKDKIISIVQKALDATFPGMFFDIEFVTRRDKTECDLLCTDAYGNKQDILTGCGGGLKQIISFALRVAVWSLDKKASPVILLDEPMTFVSEGMRQLGADLITTLSKDLGIQFIVVSHTQEVIAAGTCIYKVKQDKEGVSQAKLI
jgi:DNA repair exonuclease SbcCD ATPase subunit